VSVTTTMQDKRGRVPFNFGWKMRHFLHWHGLLDVMGLPPAGAKTEAALQAAIAAGAPPSLPRSNTRTGRPRGRPRKSHNAHGGPDV
jgi:hypothetical protein